MALQLLLLFSAGAALQAPHVLYVLMDDVGTADIWGTTIPTPFFDSIRGQGIELAHHYAHATCTPTRAALLTGRYAINTGLTSAMLPGSLAGLPDTLPTLPQLLRQQGYAAHMVGKWHLGHSKWKQTPVGRGFQTHVGCFMWDLDSYTKQMHREPWKPMAVDWIRAWENRSFVHFAEHRHATVALTEEAQTRIRTHARDPAMASTPLFLYLAYTAAHSPLQPEPAHAARCGHVAHEWRRDFCGMVVGLDEGIRNVTETALHELGQNVVVVLTSDNGASPWFGGLNSPARSGKTTPFEGGVRVPALVLDPSGLYLGGGGRVHQGLVHASDWLPTILGFTEGGRAAVKALREQGGLDGIDVGPLLRGEEAAEERDEVLLEMYLAGEVVWPNEWITAYRAGKWKLIEGMVRDPNWYWESSANSLNSSDATWVTTIGERVIRFFEPFFGKGPFDTSRVVLTHTVIHSQFVQAQPSALLFDVEADPEERRNVFAEFPAVVRRLRERIDHYREHRPVQQQWWMTLDPETAWPASFVAGNCSGAHLHGGPALCRFTHPFLDDDVDGATVPLTHGLASRNKALQGMARAMAGMCLVCLIAIFVFWRCLQRGKAHEKRE